MIKSGIKPLHYELTFKPNAKTFEFEGNVKIFSKITEETNTITLHALKLKINETIVRIANGKELYPVDTKFSEAYETVSLTFENKFKSDDTITIEINYTGALNDKLKGFYRTKYFVDDEPRYGFVTQFAPTDSRICFPSVDEPTAKATFDITLIVDKKLTALSNMQILSEFEDNQGFKVIKFDRTPIMSTYLVAMVIGEFDYVEKKSEDGVLCRVYTPLGKKEQGTYSLDVAIKSLSFCKKYFGVKYPLKKLDLVAVADFALGAMENWGLITFTEARLLVDPVNTSLAIKQRIAVIVSHEVSHQWFGNLVTMFYWSYLWLNEGFASFMENLITHDIYPNYEIWSQFVSNTFAVALKLDSLRNSHPIEVQANSSSEIDELFDAISYNKGASIIRMLYHYIGDESFRKGMNIYFTRHMYGNTKSEDLWNALAEGSGKSVAELMNNWIKHVGFPLVTVVKSIQSGSDVVLTLKQERFIADGSMNDVDDVIWMIPVQISTASDSKASEILFDKQMMDVVVKNVKESDWIKINYGTVGFYRTQYLPHMIQAFEKHKVIKNKILSSLDRLGLIDDLFALVKAGKASTVEFLKMLESYKDEDEYVVWKTIIENLIEIRTLLSNFEGMIKPFKNFCQELLKNIHQKLTWTELESDKDSDILLRPLIISQLIECGHEPTIEEARTKFGSIDKVPVDLRQAIYKAMLCKAQSLSEMINLYRNSTSEEEKMRIYGSFSVINDPVVIEEALNFSLSSDIRSTDTARMLPAIAKTRNGRYATWLFFKENINRFKEMFGDGTYILPHLVEGLTKNFACTEEANEVEEFFKENKLSGIDRTVQQSIESIYLNEKWFNRDEKNIEMFLKPYEDL